MLWAALLLPLVAAVPAPAGVGKRDVDTTYPYTGPQVPVGDLADQTVQGNGKGYRRLRMPPAVTPTSGVTVTNNINVISTALFPGGVNVHFQTPFGIGGDPVVHWGADPADLTETATGFTHT
jgi:acid phosphatase